MTQTEPNKIQDKESPNSARVVLDVLEGWEKLTAGEITEAQFQERLISLRDSFLTFVDRPNTPH